MTKRQAISKCKELNKNIHNDVIAECNRLIDSGGVDIDSYPKDYALAKVLVSVALINISTYYKPYTKQAKKDIKNLRNI